MDSISKSLSLLLIVVLLITSSLLIIQYANAQSIPKPSVPEFTATLVQKVYNNPAVYSIDPYTGKNITITPAETVETRSIFLKIKNQPFVSYSDEAGHLIELYYRVQSKGNFSDLWRLVQPGGVDGYAKASNDNYTELEFGANYYPPKAVVDFQVEAMSGYVREYDNPITYRLELVFEGQVSGWSNTQTIAIPETSTSTSPSPNPTPTPTVPELSWLAIIPLMVSILSVAVIIRKRMIGFGKHQ
jgi:hypothetical protein